MTQDLIVVIYHIIGITKFCFSYIKHRKQQKRNMKNGWQERENSFTFRVKNRKYRKNVIAPNVLKLAVAEVGQFPHSVCIINLKYIVTFNYWFVCLQKGSTAVTMSPLLYFSFFIPWIDTTVRLILRYNFQIKNVAMSFASCIYSIDTSNDANDFLWKWF